MRGLFVVLMVFSGVAHAAPEIHEETDYYIVNGQSAADIRRAMREKGPNGYWAYTNWYVRWTEDCDVSVSIDITLPRLVNRSALPLDYLAAWDAMIEILIAHENQHAQHGINAANEIEAAKCQGGRTILNKWAEQDRIFDRETQNGYLQGVDLPR